MKTRDLFKEKQVFSFEVFPPKTSSSIESIYNTIDELTTLQPDFISVTYGAAGANDTTTIDIASDIKNRRATESVAHLPGINLSRDDAARILARLQQNNIENVLALRGDITPGTVSQGDFLYANELVSFIKEHGDFNVIGACYPEGHTESDNIEDDLAHLKNKVDAGVDHLLTQLFFDNCFFYDFSDKCRKMGIAVPIEAGIMPVLSKAQIERMVALSGATIPHALSTLVARYGDDPTSMFDAGVDYACTQIADLQANGVDGVHLYTMNNPLTAKTIMRNLGMM